MRFIIAKPADYLSFGDLFYTKPRIGANREPFEQLAEICRKRAEEVFSRSKDNPENEAILQQIEEELRIIEKTDMSIAVLIMKEISDLSNEMGYLTTLLGSESGLIILYLLGISGIHPRQYNYSTIPSDLYWTEADFALGRGAHHREMIFTLATAEPVLEKIIRRLEKRFGKASTVDNIYYRIALPDSERLEKIGEYAKKTGIDYRSIDLEDPALLKAVCNDICRDDLKIEQNFDYPDSSLALARLYAYARCCSETKDRFAFVKDYVFRDDIYKALTEASAHPIAAFGLARNWEPVGENKNKDIERIKQYEVPAKMIEVYRGLMIQWSAASCLARVNSMLMVKFYENRLNIRSEGARSKIIRMDYYI